METDPLETAGFSLDKLPFYGRVLLLQGPVGPFFGRLARLLEHRGSSVTKVNFNFGDDWYFPKGDVVRFSGALDQWPAFLQALIVEGNYDAIFLFGDCRPIHRPVGAIAGAAGCEVWVFEEGYFRPGYITLERNGVNAFSAFTKLDSEELREEPITPIAKATEFPDSFQRMACQAFTYFAMMWFGALRYPRYVHHKPNGWIEAFRWVRWGVRRWVYALAQARTINRVLSVQRKNRFFVFPLQVHNDAQLHAHSDAHGIHVCLTHVMKSFAQNACQNDWLVIKHHPLDRGHTNYSGIIAILTSELGLAGRVHYIHDVHLPTLFDHCKGLVTVNSTAGLQGLHHKLPIVTLGRSFYSKPGLTFQEGLDSFWRTDWKPDHDLYLRFRACIIAKTQINSSFYADASCGSKLGFSRDAAPAGDLKSRGFEASRPASVGEDSASIGSVVSL